jgi:glycosyltransferase involved in cell wall biosynthesis
MFCSVVIPSIGRETLSRAVHSILEQTFTTDNFEVIVVNDSGRPLLKAEWQDSERVRVINTNRRERSVARNTGAAIAKGKYLYFLDDDDWLLPNTLEHFKLLAGQASDAVWLYGGIKIVDETGKCLAEVNSGLNGNCFAQVMGGAWAPIQASLIQTEAFFTVGGYSLSICGTEDLDLCRRIARHGNFANMPATVACLLRGQTWRTSTNYARAPEDTYHSREEVLSQPGAFRQMIASADSSYWHGRIFRIYMSAMLFNLRRKRLFTAMSRAIFGLAGFALAGRHGWSRSFWQAAKAHHAPNTLHFIMKRLEQEARQNEG